jgi:hypothetical protein
MMAPSPVFAPLLVGALNEVQSADAHTAAAKRKTDNGHLSVGARVCRWQIDDNQWSNGLGFARSAPPRATEEEAGKNRRLL